MARFNENFISYHSFVEDQFRILGQFERIDERLLSTRVTAERSDLLIRRAALEWKLILEKADEDFRLRRFEKALAGYKTVSKKILALIEPKIDKLTLPEAWFSGKEITQTLLEASASMLGQLLPEQQDLFAVLPETPYKFDIPVLNAIPESELTATNNLPEKALAAIKSGNIAAEQGQWEKARNSYNNAYKLAGQSDGQLQAEILLNLGAIEIQRKESASAFRVLKRAQGLFKKAGDQLGEAEVLHNLGLAHLVNGSGEEALAALDEAKKIAGQASLKGLLENSKEGQSTKENVLVRGTTISNFGRIPTYFTSKDLGNPNAGYRLSANLSNNYLKFQPRRIDTEKLADALGSHDLTLKFRPVNRNHPHYELKLQTPSQEKIEDFGRMLTIQNAGGPVTLNWNRKDGLKSSQLREAEMLRVNSSNPTRLGFVVNSPEGIIINLPHLYHLVLPIKMGTCYKQLGEYEKGHQEFLRAGNYELINLKLEAPDLWRRMAENVVAWGDSLYRDEKTEEALPVYGLLITDDGKAANSVFYTLASLSTTGEKVSDWLKAIVDNTALPDLNPAIAHLLHTVRKRWTYINAGLDFFGNQANIVSPFSFKYLQEVARYFAQRAIQAEQRYIDFYTRFENEQMTRDQLENAKELANLEEEAAIENEAAARATLEAAAANVHLANIRHQNAGNLLSQFNNVAWEMEVLAGHIARGNAWTGGDLPNLHYSAGGRYDFDGPKHEVLQELTMRQTEISNDLQQTRLQNSEAELNAAKGIAAAQQNIAQARLNAAVIEAEIAEKRAEHANEMLQAFNDQKFNPEQWLAMASLMRGLSNTAMYRAIEVSRLMQKAYNFENFDNRSVIRNSYNLTWTQNLLGGEVLLNDIDSFTHYHVTKIKEKPIPVKWAVSLPEEFPGQFLLFKRTGRMEFEIDLERIKLYHPGTYLHQLVGVELEVDGFLPPTGLHGRLTNSGLGRYRDRADNTHLRLQPAETLILSRYSRRQDMAILTPPQEMRNLFEGNSPASGWTLEVPRISNDVDLNLVFDIRLVLYFECAFDQQLFTQDSTPPSGQILERSNAFNLRHHFPDAFYQLKETGRAELEVNALDFPYHHYQPILKKMAIAISPESNESLSGAQLSVVYPGQGNPLSVTVSGQETIPASLLPVNGTPSALGTFQFEIAPDQLDQKDKILDLVFIWDYQYEYLG